MKNITTIRFTVVIQEYNENRTNLIKEAIGNIAHPLEWSVCGARILVSFDRVFIDTLPCRFIDSILFAIYQANGGFCKVHIGSLNLTLAPKSDKLYDNLAEYETKFAPLLMGDPPDKDTLFVVRMLRWGDSECHSYVVGVYEDKQTAIDVGFKEGVHRGGKYEPVVEPFTLNDIPKYDWEEVVGNV